VNNLNLGHLVSTRGVAEWLDEGPFERRLAASNAVARHKSGDWGVVCDEDRQANDRAAAGDERVLSAYDIDGRRLWIITEWDRSVTTVLFPEEY